MEGTEHLFPFLCSPGAATVIRARCPDQLSEKNNIWNNIILILLFHVVVCHLIILLHVVVCHMLDMVERDVRLHG